MNVQELIEALVKFPPDTSVFVNDGSQSCLEIKSLDDQQVEGSFGHIGVNDFSAVVITAMKNEEVDYKLA